MVADHGGFFQFGDFGVGVGHGTLRGLWERLTIHGGNYGGVEKGQGLRGSNAKPRPRAKPVSVQPAGSEARGGFESYAISRIYTRLWQYEISTYPKNIPFLAKKHRQLSNLLACPWKPSVYAGLQNIDVSCRWKCGRLSQLPAGAPRQLGRVRRFNSTGASTQALAPHCTCAWKSTSRCQRV